MVTLYHVTATDHQHGTDRLCVAIQTLVFIVKYDQYNYGKKPNSHLSRCHR